jgi:hypothetical protein
MEDRRKNSPGRGERRKDDAARIADALKRRGTISMFVQGTGMLPLVQPGDVALIRRAKLENMKNGDVVLFQRGEHLTARRIGEETADPPKANDSTAAAEVPDNESQLEEYLGQIVKLHRQLEEIDLTHKRKPIAAIVSRILKPARRIKNRRARRSNTQASR